MKEQNKVLIIGLDGATWTVLKPWLDEGKLPHLAKLIANGCWGDLRSTIPPLTAPAWSSFLTGKNPGKHGVFHFIDIDDIPEEGGREQADIVDARTIKSATLWDIVAHHGLKAGVVNVPMSYPPRPVNGFMVTGLLTPPDAAIFTYPPELSEQITDYQIDLDRFIKQKPFAGDGDQPKPKRVVKPSLQLMREFQEMEEKRCRLTLSLMDTEDWNVCMVVFTASDRMGHYLWPYHLVQDLDGSPESMALHEAIVQYYVRLDEMIGELVTEAGEGATTVLMSDHGMGRIYTKNTHWNNWLFKKGYLQIDSSKKSSPDSLLLQIGVPRDKLRKMVSWIPGLTSSKTFKKMKKAPTARIDFANSKAHYVRIFDPVGGIRINAQGEEREALCEELMTAVKTLTDPATGQPIVRWVFRREECYHGPYVADKPDIILIMYPDYGSSDRLSHYSAIVTDRPNISDPGGHHIEGIFVATGPEVTAKAEPLPDLLIEDMAPTIIHLLGLPVPDDMDGRVLTEILTSESLQVHPIEMMPSPGKWPSEEEAEYIVEDLSFDDAEAVRDRLRALGYFE